MTAVVKRLLKLLVAVAVVVDPVPAYLDRVDVADVSGISLFRMTNALELEAQTFRL